MNASGVCVGSSTITRVDIRKKNDVIEIVGVMSKTHDGNIRKTFKNLVADQDLKSLDKIALTGRKFKNLIKLPSISEPEAIEWAYSFLKEKYGEAAYISCAGGETLTAPEP